MPTVSRLLLSCLLLSSPAMAAPATPLSTLAEQSGFQRTGRYDEVLALCTAFAERYPQQVRCEDFGTSPEGRPMKVLIASTAGALDPQTASARKLPVVLIQGGIHAGEIDGKDAGFLALRQLLDGEAGHHALDRAVLLFVPVFNVDGHERFGAWNRPNQRGPEEMGWRTTAQNLNLNRDYVKADAPEMQAMLALVNRWDPLIYVDLHATNGAQFQHDISIQVEPVHAGDPPLRSTGRALRDGVIADLAAQGALPLPYYPSFVVNDDPASGFEDGVPTPRFSHGYFQLRNRIGVLVETHSWKTYPVRVGLTRNTIVSVLEQSARHGAGWRAEALAADRRSSALAGTAVPLAWATGPEAHPVDFLGYAYTRTPSEVSGALMTRYDETTPQVWRVPMRDTISPSVQVVAPRGGYIVPAAHAEAVGAKLRQHGIDFRTVASSKEHPLQTFRAGKSTPAAQPVEGHQRLQVSGQWQEEKRTVPAGSLFVPIAQPRARLAMTLLEPQAPDSLLQWGWFNNQFERKEYMEDYVAEQVARQMLDADPELRSEFERRLRDEPAFAADPAARLDFFYRRHSAWDERYQLYPVMRSDVSAF
ncbi:peptidase M14 [Stenotrophomonas pictorum JCM 9942]|uniref:Peptidase M14 n=2 Tax=Stenotrophomonas pictorum TaxID=86184 RepID=A0A0R0ADJ3_9GAMM|nr:M14 family metallopeptidase [Stenotrophomonas pictorum]KRG42797.1 peptidase M14 [Stenotrophomonas pictorum JCM 9942]